MPLINNTNETYTKNSYKILFRNIKYLNNTIVFRNTPRNSNLKSTFEKFNDNNKIFEPWPINDNYDYNNNNLLLNCSFFISIISFEFDEENNIYLLDEGNDNCPIGIFKFNAAGQFINKYSIYNRSNNNNINLTNFVIDKINNYYYIPFTDISYDKKYEVGIFKRKIDEKDKGECITLNNDKFLSEERYNYSDIFKNYSNYDKFLEQNKMINIALSCDAKYLLISPLSSRMIYSILTQNLIKSEKNISINDVKEAYKNDISSALISSNLGNLYLTGLEQKVIYMAGQIDYDLSIFDFKILDEISNYNDNDFPTHLYITDGNLLINYINIYKNNSDSQLYINTKIYIIPTDKEKSYIFKCGGLIYKWNWNSYIIWSFFCIIFGLILAFVYIGNQQDIDINKKN